MLLPQCHFASPFGIVAMIAQAECLSLCSESAYSPCLVHLHMRSSTPSTLTGAIDCAPCDMTLLVMLGPGFLSSNRESA